MNFFNRYCNKHKCTCWFDSLFNIDWSKCCMQHDLDIIHKLTKTSHEADTKLFRCVWKKLKPMAVIMWIGVKPMSWIAWKYYRRNEK